MKTYKFTILCPGCFLDGTQVAFRAESPEKAASHIRVVISRGKGTPTDFQLSPI